MRDRLIELLKESHEIVKRNGFVFNPYVTADYLLENGVIVPKYKVGDTVWYITGTPRTIVKSAIVDEIIINCNGIIDLFVTSDIGSFGNSVDIFYSTKEEAEKALKGGVQE